MTSILDRTGLAHFWEKIKNLLATGTAQKAQSIPFGEVDSTSTATAFTATVEGITALEDGVCCYLKNTVITSAAASTAPKCFTLDINDLGAKPVYQVTAAASYATTHFTKNYKFLFTYDSSLNSGNGGWYIGQIFNSNTTYSDMTQAEIDAGTGTTGRKITPKKLRDNFYTESEIDGLLADKADSADLATVATSGSYNDLTNKPDIPTVPSNVSAFTNDAGYITGYTETDPVFAASAAHGITSTDISNWNGKQAAINDLADIRNGAALGATALQSFTESDPTVPAWAKASTKPSYTASEVGALPSDTPLFSGDYNDLDNKPAIPTKVSDLTNDSGFTSNTGTITGITMNGASKGTSGVVNLGTVITEHQDISGKANTTDVYTKAEVDAMLSTCVLVGDTVGNV